MLLSECAQVTIDKIFKYRHFVTCRSQIDRALAADLLLIITDLAEIEGLTV